MSTSYSRLLALLPAAIALPGCETPNVFLPSYQPGGPQGVLDGSVTYQGPLPCTEGGHVVGAAVYLAFDTRLLPPPQGVGLTAASLGTTAGDTLFGGVTDQLTYNKDGSLWCPQPGTSVTVSGNWTVGPLPGGTYEVRAFYDLHGQFDPAFSISRLPHEGDIAGGAIDNVSAVLMGAAPSYRQIQLGTEPGSGPCTDDKGCSSFGTGYSCQQGYCMPPEGANIGGVAVTLGLPLATGLPIFNPSAVTISAFTCENGTKTPTNMSTMGDVTQLSMPSDYTLPDFSNLGAQDSLIRVDLTAGVAANEVMAASQSPFNFPVTGSPTFAFSWQDVNGDGMIDLAHDHVAASSLIPALYPLSIFTKLASPTNDLTVQASPFVLIEGLTLYKDLFTTISIGQSPTMPIAPASDVIVGVTPAVLCLDPNDFSPTATAKLVLTHEKDCSGMNPVLMDEMGTTMALSTQFGRPVQLVFGCLPQGRYNLNLVYGTGQAWSVPNEAGVCAPTEPESADQKFCVGSTPQGMTQRARLASQDIVLTVGAPQDAMYCVNNPTPPECCPALTDPKANRVDTTTGQCKCPNDPKTPTKYACQ